MTTYFEKGAKILVPTDFSDTCSNALDHAKSLAAINTHEICVLHVVKNTESEASTREEISVAEAKIASLLNSKQIKATSIVRAGDIFSAISSVAEEINAELIVLGTHGKVGMQKLLGSYALKVIDSTKLPVLVVQGAHTKHEYKKIVFTVGLSEEDRQKAEHAAAFAHTYGSKVYIFTEEANFDHSKKKVETAIAQLKKYFTTHEVAFEIADSTKYTGSFDRQVASYSKDVNADLIFIVSDPEKHMFLGGGKEESFLFNPEGIPILVVTNKKFKSSKFSMF